MPEEVTTQGNVSETFGVFDADYGIGFVGQEDLRLLDEGADTFHKGECDRAVVQAGGDGLVAVDEESGECANGADFGVGGYFHQICAFEFALAKGLYVAVQVGDAVVLMQVDRELFPIGQEDATASFSGTVEYSFLQQFFDEGVLKLTGRQLFTILQPEEFFCQRES